MGRGGQVAVMVVGLGFGNEGGFCSWSGVTFSLLDFEKEQLIETYVNHMTLFSLII